MAKRRRRPTTAVKPVQNDQQSNQQRAVDGFINSLAYLGEASELSAANDYERHSITRDYELLTVMYRENWLAKRIIDTPCEDMTRSWYSVSSEIEQEKLDELMKLEAKHNVKQEITNGLRWARLYGGAAAVIVIKGQEDMLDQPLDFDMIMPGSFRGLIVVDRTNGLYPSLELEEDMDDPEYGYPKWYNVILDQVGGETLLVHHSRLLQFRGRMLPIQEEINEDYWGASELEHIYEELQKRNATSANIAQLVFQANVSALKISDYGEALAMAPEKKKQQILEAIYNMNRIRNSFGLLLMGSEDNYEQHPYSFAGIAEVYESFMMDMAGAAEIPATKLFGRSPQGMNATGESDMKNYYEMLAQLQERNLRPAIEKLLPIMAMSLWGTIPEDMEVVFEPLMTTSPSERADIMGKQAQSVMQLYTGGIISQRTALLELQEQGKAIGAWTNITDEDIEKADDEVDQGEGMQDPMGMMGPGQEGGMPPQEAPAEQQQPSEPEDEQTPDPEEKPQEAPQKPKEMQPESDAMADLRKQVMQAAENGDFDTARALIAKYKESRKEADEKPEKKPGLIRRLADLFRGKDFDESKVKRDKNGRFSSTGGGGQSSKGNSSEPVDYSPQTEHNKVKASFAKAIPKKFRQTFHAAKAAIAKDHPEDSWRVDSTYTDDDYAHMDCYTTEGGSAVAVHDGDIVSVCHNPGDKVRGSELLKHALANGGKKLDAFSGLYGFYAKNGFEPVSWCEFDEEYAPSDWVKGRDEPEPVIFWKHTGRSFDEISRDHGRNAVEFTAKVKASAGYEEAKDVRDKQLEG